MFSGSSGGSSSPSPVSLPCCFVLLQYSQNTSLLLIFAYSLEQYSLGGVHFRMLAPPQLCCCCLQAANHTCGDFDRGVDEFQQSGLTPVPSKLVKPPRVRESAVQMECKLRQVIEFKDR
jgi:hypothetical protein